MTKCFPEKSRWCCCEQVCREINTLSHPRDYTIHELTFIFIRKIQNMTPEILNMASNYLISDLVLPVMRIRAWSKLLAFCLNAIPRLLFFSASTCLYLCCDTLKMAPLSSGAAFMSNLDISWKDALRIMPADIVRLMSKKRKVVSMNIMLKANQYS